MARIETDPNYSSPTFSRATAAADLFKKEDVQSLASALSTHVHDGAGKGLAVVPAAGSIPGSALADGSITSAKIADGTIGTLDLAPNSTAYVRQAVAGVTNGPTTTSVTMVDIPDMVVNVNSTYDAMCLVLFQGIFIAGPLGSDLAVQLIFDGGTLNGGTAFSVSRTPAASIYIPLSVWGVVGVSAGPHAIKAQWSISSGTATAHFIYRSIEVMDFYR